MNVNQGADAEKQGTKDIPKPKTARAESVRNLTTDQLIADTVGNSVEPDQAADAKGKRRNNEIQKAIMHGLFAVVTTANKVDIIRNG